MVGILANIYFCWTPLRDKRTPLRDKRTPYTYPFMDMGGYFPPSPEKYIAAFLSVTWGNGERFLSPIPPSLMLFLI